MKTILKICLIIFVLSINTVGISQDTIAPLKPSTEEKNKVDTGKKAVIPVSKDEIPENKDSSELDKKIAEMTSRLDKLIKLVEESKDTSLDIGTLILNKKPIIIYKSKTNFKPSDDEVDNYKEDSDPSTECWFSYKKLARRTRKTIIEKSKVKEARVDINDGVISDIYVLMENGLIFSNKDAPINLERLLNGNDNLQYLKADTNYKIYLNSVLLYKPIKGYMPNDVNILLTPTDSFKLLQKNIKLDELINVKLYTDVLGLINRESNGIIQTEIDFKVPIHRKNYKNYHAYFVRDLNVNLQLSRFDENNSRTEVDTTNYLSRMEFNQRKWFNVEIGLNLFQASIQEKWNNFLVIDIIGGFGASDYYSKTDSGSKSLVYLGVDPKIVLRPAPNFGLILSGRFYAEQFPDKREESYGKTEWVFAPKLDVYYNPLKNTANRLFTRIEFNNFSRDKKSFWKFQFGYNISITDAINMNK